MKMGRVALHRDAYVTVSSIQLNHLVNRSEVDIHLKRE
jgi:hypothetical protein